MFITREFVQGSGFVVLVVSGKKYIQQFRAQYLSSPGAVFSKIQNAESIKVIMVDRRWNGSLCLVSIRFMFSVFDALALIHWSFSFSRKERKVKTRFRLKRIPRAENTFVWESVTLSYKWRPRPNLCVLIDSAFWILENRPRRTELELAVANAYHICQCLTVSIGFETSIQKRDRIDHACHEP